MITWNVHLRRANNYIDQNVIIKKLNNKNNTRLKVVPSNVSLQFRQALNHLADVF